MGTKGLDEAVRRGAPLVEITVSFVEGVDFVSATEAVNNLSDQIHLDNGDWYNCPSLRVGSATKEALEALFGWKLMRVPLERFEDSTKTWGHWPDTFRWEESQPLQKYPESIVGLIANIGYSQPGAGDEGQWYE